MAFAAALALFGAGCGSDAETNSTGSAATPTTATSSTVMASVISTTVPSTTAPSTTVSSTATSTAATTGSETTVADDGSIDNTLQVIVDIATSDLSARLGVDPSSITVVSAKAMTWPDGSLGCPRAGMEYLQVLVDGALIELQTGGEIYSYHSGDDGKPTLCEQGLSGQKIPPATTG